VDPVLTGGLTLLGVIVASYLTYRASTRKQRSDNGQQMIDQHQEDIAELRKESTVQRGRISTLERTQRIQGDYIGQLRKHIADGHPPPPPPYPDALIP
jgi:hypothetical protein